MLARVDLEVGRAYLPPDQQRPGGCPRPIRDRQYSTQNSRRGECSQWLNLRDPPNFKMQGNAGTDAHASAQHSDERDADVEQQFRL